MQVWLGQTKCSSKESKMVAESLWYITMICGVKHRGHIQLDQCYDWPFVHCMNCFTFVEVQSWHYSYELASWLKWRPYLSTWESSLAGTACWRFFWPQRSPADRPVVLPVWGLPDQSFSVGGRANYVQPCSWDEEQCYFKGDKLTNLVTYHRCQACLQMPSMGWHRVVAHRTWKQKLWRGCEPHPM